VTAAPDERRAGDEPVEIRRDSQPMPRSSDRVEPLLVSHDEEDIRTAIGVFRGT